MADISEIIEDARRNIRGTSSLGDAFVEDVCKLIASFGYALQEGDGWFLGFSVQKVENDIKNQCNISSVPDELYEVAAEMAAGEFLFAKKGAGQLAGFEVDLSTAVSQLKEGDTSVTFSGGSQTPEQRLETLISYLLSAGKDQFVSFRRLKW